MIFLINLPPPVHGMSLINKKMTANALEHLKNTVVVNSSPTAEQSNISKLKKIYNYLLIIVKFGNVLKSTNIKDSLYRPINGGKGQFFDMVFLMLAKIYRRKIFIHHHSYNYLNKKSFLFTLVNKICSVNSIHIVLSEDMKVRLSQIYDIELSRIRVLSNCAFIDDPKLEHQRINKVTRILNIGYLSNVTVDKGIDVFINICEEILARGIKINPQIAGPINDKKSKKIIDDFCIKYPFVNYVGPVYGEDKTRFLNDLDVFIFPSRYYNEAEPLVIYEAAASGNYVIGSEVGSMKEAIKKIAGFSYPLNMDSDVSQLQEFIETTVKHLINLNKEDFDKINKTVIDSFRKAKVSANDDLMSILKEFENV
ncbi:glycosyltransferase family 4 protein [Klebsiella quasipneumoniae]|nr:glycosyltransferase family 4 protein [Klebsiella quasipneumoniae]